MFELLVIGAGPHSLTTLLRLLEPQGDCSVDARRRKPTSKAALERRAHKQRCDNAYRDALADWLRRHVCVIDENGGAWLKRWGAQFSSLQIPYLRSNSALHVDPHDAYALVNYAEEMGREREVQPLRSIDKDDAFHGPFHSPGSRLFEDHCLDCITRYCMDKIVQRGQVVALQPVRDAAGCVTHHAIRLADGRTLLARRVLLGIGSTNMKRIPPFAADLIMLPQTGAATESCQAGGSGDDEGGTGGGAAEQGSPAAGSSQAAAQRACSDAGLPPAGVVMHSWDLVAAAGSTVSESAAAEHSSAISAGGDVEDNGACPARCCDGHHADPAGSTSVRKPQPLRCPAVDAPAVLASAGLVRPGDRVAIVGGGLTSAHLTQLAVASGAAQVTLVLRGPLRIKQFDVDTVYMGRLRGEQLSLFRRLGGWEQRLKVMRNALQGGSLTPEAYAGLQPLLKAGVLRVVEHCALGGAGWDAGAHELHLWSEDGAVELRADRLWLATGSQVDAHQERLTSSMLQHVPIPVHGGLPCLQPSLEWAPGSGVYVLGAYAALVLGPGALNLAGARTGSVLVVDALRKAAGGEAWLQELQRVQCRHLLSTKA